MENCRNVQFNLCKSSYGSLVALENLKEIPFKIERIYYIFDVGEDVRRGFHAHRNLEQVLICLAGSVKILVKTPEDEVIYELCKPNEGIFIGKMIWREMYDFSPGSVLLVVASKYFDEGDYIRSYNQYAHEFLLGRK